MMVPSFFDLHPEVAAALQASQPVVALESTLIAHGLPWPLNLETARAAEAAVRAADAVPATIAVYQGRPTIGLQPEQLEGLARSRDVLKASRRDLALAVARGLTAATTVAGTMFLAHQAGIRLFATGGIGGAHRGADFAWDISADLTELARTPVAVVCTGAKSMLDLPRTLEILETLAVPVVGYSTDDFPAFYVRSSGQPVSARADTPQEVAALLAAHWQLGGAGVVVAQPVPPDVALEAAEIDQALAQAEMDAAAAGLRGKTLTPFLLGRLADLTHGKTLRANQVLVQANARLAAQVARSMG
jgi:pseudouridine-5'-phosphate glycosidase